MIPSNHPIFSVLAGEAKDKTHVLASMSRHADMQATHGPTDIKQLKHDIP